MNPFCFSPFLNLFRFLPGFKETNSGFLNPNPKIKNYGSSPNSVRVKELAFSECQVIPGTRKESHIACNHEAHIAPLRWRGCPVASSRFSLAAPAALCGSRAERLWEAISRRCLRRNLTFLPGPWQASIKHSINEFGDDPPIKPVSAKDTALANLIVRAKNEEDGIMRRMIQYFINRRVRKSMKNRTKIWLWS